MGTNSPKNRDYFITINESAKCYDSALDIIKDLNVSLYAFIVHDKDIDEDGNLKAIHKHIVLELKNAITFNSIRNKFEGAHIELINQKKSAYQYLLHQSPRSKEKYQYTLDSIITNDVEHLKYIIESENLEQFIESRFLEYISEGINTRYAFVKRFGLTAYKNYWRAYSEMLDELRHNTDTQDDYFALLGLERIENEKYNCNDD